MLASLLVSTSNAQLLKKIKKAAEKEIQKVSNELSKGKKEKSNEAKYDEQSKGEENLDGKKNEVTSTVTLDGLIYEPPKPDFRSFSLQKHKDLPRFGELDTHGAKRKIKRPLDYETYTELLHLKYGSILNKSLILNSASLETFLEYFCNADKGSCNEQNRDEILNFPHLRHRGGVARNWGGYGANQFEKERKKNDFMKTHLPTLQAWSKSIWQNDSEEGYVVKRHPLRTYDFDHGGFWVPSITNPPGKGTGLVSNAFILEYIPKNKFESEMKDGYVLLKVSESEAEKLVTNKTQYVYSVVKIKLGLKEVLEPHKELTMGKKLVHFKYNYENSIREFYEDESLTKKIGEISYENAVYSNTSYHPSLTQN